MSVAGFLGVLGLIVWITWPTPEPVDLEPARATLRAAGLPGSFEEFAATIEDVPDEENAALPFLEAGRVLDGEDELLELLRAMSEVPPIAGLREHAGVDLELRQYLEEAATRQAAEDAAALADLRSDPRTARLADQLQDLPGLLGDDAADPDRFDPPLRAVFIRELLEEQRELIDRVLHAATKQPRRRSSYGVDWKDHETRLFEKELPHLRQQRTLSHLLQAAASQAAADEDLGRSLRAVEAMLAQAEALASDAHLFVVMLVAAGLDQAASATVGEMLQGPTRDDLSEPERAALLRITDRLADEDRFRSAFRQSFFGEAAAGIQVFDLFADFETIARKAFPDIDEERLALNPDSQRYARVLASIPPALDAETETAGVDLLDRRSRSFRGLDADDLIVSSLFLPNLEGAVVAQSRTLAARRVARVAIACRLFAADHGGELPATLDVLVPDYLDAVPIDPTDGGGLPVRYDRERAIVWTSGWDNDDDGGVSLADLEAAEPEGRAIDFRGRFDQVVRLRP